jgi:DNA-binding CsgD family transcriptional regulator
MGTQGDPRHFKKVTKLATARRSLRQAVRTVEKALGPGTGAPSKGPNAGRWKVVDSFEHGRQRYVVARAVRSAGGLSSLTEAERSVVSIAAGGATTKEIAHDLGLAAATVRVLLMRAVRRCHVNTRVELLRLWREEQARPFTTRLVSALDVAPSEGAPQRCRP